MPLHVLSVLFIVSHCQRRIVQKVADLLIYLQSFSYTLPQLRQLCHLMTFVCSLLLWLVLWYGAAGTRYRLRTGLLGAIAHVKELLSWR